MIANIDSCRRLQALVRQLGAELPDSLARPLAAYDAVDRLRRRPSDAESLTTLMAGAGPIDDDALDALIDRTAQNYARAQVSRGIAEQAESVCLQTFRQQLMSDGGDELTERLRPAFNAACFDLVQVMSLVSPGMTANAAIEAGPDTVAAWKLAATLTDRFRAFEDYAILVGRDFNTVGMGVTFSHPAAPTVAFFLPPGQDLEQAGRAFTKDNSEYRGGKFHSLVVGSQCSLDLISPRLAQASCNGQADIIAEAEAAQQDALNRSRA